MNKHIHSCQDATTTLSLHARDDYVNTSSVRDLSTRALSYLEAGFPLHLRGPAGSGKTTLAFRLAAEIGRPAMFLVGDETMTTADLIGKQTGYQHRKVVDRFIHSVLKFEENVEQQWTAAKLTVACREGYTLIYDEFTRSRPEANNVLLAVLEEKLLALPIENGAGEYVKVHPDFRIIFTSNPREYAGVHSFQDALNDRIVTLDVDYSDESTEVAIVAARAKLSPELTAPIVKLVRAYRASGAYQQIPTPRVAIMIARMVAARKLKPTAGDGAFVQLCLDQLEGKCMRAGDLHQHRETLLNLIETYCQAPCPANGRSHANTAKAACPQAAVLNS